jgi:hypothetical protein
MHGETSQSQCNPFIDGFLGRVPRDIADSFTPDQLSAVQRAFGMRYAMAHRVDLRRTVRLPWGRFYLVLLAGRDDRADGRASFTPYLAAAALVGMAGAVLMLLA